MVIRFNPFVNEAVARLEAVRTFAQIMENGIPELHDNEQQRLTTRSREESWPEEEHNIEGQILEKQFETYLPRLAAYSSVILLFSVVETLLDDLARYLERTKKSHVCLHDMAGKGIERSALYLDRIFLIRINDNPSWSQLQDLQKLRNILVHQHGQIGEKPPKHWLHLAKQYSRGLTLDDEWGVDKKIKISFSLILEFADCIRRFFETIFRNCGLERLAYE